PSASGGRSGTEMQLTNRRTSRFPVPLILAAHAVPVLSAPADDKLAFVREPLEVNPYRLGCVRAIITRLEVRPHRDASPVVYEGSLASCPLIPPCSRGFGRRE